MTRPRLPAIFLAALGVCWALSCGPTAAQEPDPEEPLAGEDLVAETERNMLQAVQDGDMQRAFVILDAARNRGLPMGMYHLLKARAYALQRNADAEEQELLGAIRRDPTLAEAYLRLAHIMEGRGLWLDAVDLHRKAIEARPSDVRAYLELSRILLDRGRHRSGIETLQGARLVAPGNAHVWARLAAAHERVGDTGRAREEYREAARLGAGETRRWALLRAADLALADGDHAEAFAHYRTAVAEGAAVGPGLYARMSVAADETLWAGIGPSWEAYEDYMAAREDAPAREELHVMLSAALEGARELTNVMDRIAPPEGFAGEHTRRRLQNGLVCETLTSAITYLDTGDETLLTNSRARWADALAARHTLQDMRRRRPPLPD